MATIIGAVIAAACYFALRRLNILPTVRMFLMFFMGCGIAAAIGGVIVWAWGLLHGATGFLPWQVGAVVTVIPAGIAVYCMIICFAHLKPKNQPDSHTQWAAFVIPVMALLVTGGIVGTVGDKLTSGVDQGSSQVISTVIGNGGSGPLPEAKHGGH